MNILVLNPPFKGRFSRTSRSPAVTKGGTLYYPFWLAYAVGVLERSGFKVKFIDAPAQRLGFNEVFKIAKDFFPRLTVIDTSTPSIYSDVLAAEKLKYASKENFVILVGTHPSALPKETLSLGSSVDAVAIGEYDYTLRDLALALRDGKELSSIEGIAFRGRDRGIVINQRRAYIEDLDELPFVSEVYRRHLNVRDYFFAAADYPMAMIVTGRGCPYGCFFCVYPQTLHSCRYRKRSAKDVVNEFDFIRKELRQVREVGIEDDTFTADKERVREICGLIISRRIKMRWYCNARVGLDLETLKLMRSAGCRLLAVGFESTSQEVLDGMHKGIAISQLRDFVGWVRKAKIAIHACFMAGNPGDTQKTLNEALGMAKKLNFDSAQFYPLFVYPGTEAFRWAQANKYLLTEKYDKWVDSSGGHNCVLNFPWLSNRQIMKFCKQATKEYYLRPRYLSSKIVQMLAHPQEIRRTFLSAGTFLKHLKNS